MASDIAKFTSKHSSSINGNICLPHDISSLNLNFTDFDSSWVIERSNNSQSDVSGKISSISNSTIGLIERLQWEQFLFVEKAQLEKRLNISPNKKCRSYKNVSQLGCFEFFADGDFNAIKSVSITLEETIKRSREIKTPLPIISAFEELQEAANCLIERFTNAKMVEGIEPHLSISTLSDEISILGLQAREVTREYADMKRTELGFGSFLKSVFWRFRWRLYELWIFIKLINLLEHNGAEIELLNVNAGIWKLNYSRSTSPVAIASFPQGDINIFYQLFQKSDSRSDMPDIALQNQKGKIIAVVDPKHGRSYNRSKVHKVLVRYDNSFKATLTAIVNFFPISTYQHDLTNYKSRHLLLASGFSPGTISERRFENLFNKIMYENNYFVTDQPSRPPRTFRWTAREPAIIYWATAAREINEPNGLWGFTRELGSVPIKIESIDKTSKISLIKSSQDGKNIALRGEKHLYLILGKNFILKKIKFDKIIENVIWHPSGKELLVKVGDELIMLHTSGKEKNRFNAPTIFWEPNIYWSPKNGRLLYSHKIGFFLVVAFTCLPGEKWEEILNFRPIRPRYLEVLIHQENIAGSIILQVSDIDHFIVQQNGAIEKIKLKNKFKCTSPQNRYYVLPGPISLRYADGVSLLESREVTQDNHLSFIKYFGELQGDITWSVDGYNIAFFVARRFRTGLDEIRLLTAKVDEKDTISVTYPGQKPNSFAWVHGSILRKAIK